jgi:ATP-dependent DNA helicase RecG
MIADELAEIVENLRILGSDVTDVEVKKAQGGLPKGVRESLSALSNTRGGTIILGLDEVSRFTATGLSDSAKMAKDFAATCSDEMEPPLRPFIQIHQFEGVHILVAEVPELDASQRPCYYKGAGITKGSFTRVHDGDRQLSSYEVQMMLSSRGQPREDEQPLAEASVDDLDQSLVASFVLRLRHNRPYVYSELETIDVLRRAKVVTTDPGGRDTPTVAGLLALGRYPQYHLPQIMLTVVSYPTESGPDAASGIRFLDNVAVEGPIPVMVRDAMNALRRNMSRRSVVVGAGRQDTWEYPETALREAITNALVHRDLSPASRGTQVQIEMFPDRLVIRNPGGLFGPVTVERLGEEGVSSSRNATLLKILEDTSIPGEDRTVCENRGSGIRAMLNALRKAGMSAPRFDDRISSFTVIFPNHTLLSDEVLSWLESLGETGLTDSQCIALAMLREGAVLDNATYRTATGLDSRIATAELQDLVARELVTQTGTRRWAKYQSSSGLHEIRHRRLSPADRREEMLGALGTDTLSRSELAERTGLSDQTVRRWLAILRKEGLIETTEASTSSKNTKYRRVPGSGLTQKLQIE